MESEQSQNFNERLSQWVAHQGFWFQIRYSMSGSGSRGTAMFHLLTLGVKLLVFLAIIAAGCWVYLAKRTATERFSTTMKAELSAALSTSDIEVSEIGRAQGELVVGALSARGDDQTFFTHLEAKNVHGKMGFLDGIVGEWDLGTIGISKLNVDLRAGADDADSAAKLSEALFKMSPKVLVRSFEVADATLRWGYRKNIIATGGLQVAPGLSGQSSLSADHTRGSIQNSVMKIQRGDNSMRLSFKGGTFSQGWLNKLEIVDLVVSCDRDGMTFETASFKQGQGTVDFSGLKVSGGARPLLAGELKVRHLEAGGMLDAALRSYVEGSVSGDFTISGSTNAPEGIVIDGEIVLGGQDVISVRERLPLLKALSSADYSRKYRRVDFNEGSFHLKTGGGGAEFSRVNLKAKDVFTLEGGMTVTLPSAEQARASLALGAPTGASALFNSDDSGDANSDSAGEDGEISLSQAALSAKRDKDSPGGKSTKSGPAGSSLSDRLDLSYEIQRMEEQSSVHLPKAMRYQGLFRITLLPDAFERAPKLQAGYPVDPKIQRIPINVPVEGSLYELTLKLADEIYQDARR